MYRNDTTRNLIAFDSMTELATWANKNVDTHNTYRLLDAKKFNGFTTWDQAATRAGLGHDDAVPQAKKLLDKLEASISVETIAYTSSVAGVFPNVPEYLAGEPECMMEPTPSTSDQAPLAVYVDLTTSEGITADQYRKRGIAVLALAMMLSQVRPISLHVCTVMGCRKRIDGENASLVTARIETAPLDLARAAYAMTDVAVPRRLFYGISEQVHEFEGSWPTLKGAGYGEAASPAYVKRVRELLDLGDEVLYIPAVSLFTGEAAQMVNEPVKWINAKLALYGGVTADA